jgi:hypothetical protein
VIGDGDDINVTFERLTHDERWDHFDLGARGKDGVNVKVRAEGFHG